MPVSLPRMPATSVMAQLAAIQSLNTALFAFSRISGNPLWISFVKIGTSVSLLQIEVA